MIHQSKKALKKRVPFCNILIGKITLSDHKKMIILLMFQVLIGKIIDDNDIVNVSNPHR